MRAVLGGPPPPLPQHQPPGQLRLAQSLDAPHAARMFGGGPNPYAAARGHPVLLGTDSPQDVGSPLRVRNAWNSPKADKMKLPPLEVCGRAGGEKAERKSCRVVVGVGCWAQLKSTRDVAWSGDGDEALTCMLWQ
eukprot:290209-Chlamydomonas_euryale.AAC.1